MLKKLLSVGLVGIFALLAAGCSLSDDTVAKVGKYEISKVEFEKRLKMRFSNKDSWTDVPITEKLETLDFLVQQKLRLAEAYSLGLDNDAKVQENFKRQKQNLIAQKYFEMMVVDKLVSDENITAAFERMKEEIRVSHILISYKGIPGSSATRTKEEAHQLVNELRKKAINGAKFSDLAVQYSDDKTVLRNNGDLGYFTSGRMLQEFEETAFKLKPGKISEPILTKFGYHLIKLADRRPNPNYDPGAFPDQKENIKKSLFQSYRDTAATIWNNHLQSVREKRSFELLITNIDSVVQFSKSVADKDKALDSDQYTDVLKALKLSKWDDNQLTLEDIFKEFNYDITKLKRILTTKEGLNGFVESYSVRLILFDEAEKIGVANKKDVADQLATIIEMPLIKVVEERAVLDKIEINDDDLMNYYQTNKHEFVQPQEIEIWEIFVKDKEKAEKVAKLAKSGKNFEKLVETYSEEAVIKSKKGYLGFRNQKSRGEVSETAFVLGPGKISDAIKFRGGWAIIKTGVIEPEMTKSFENSKQTLTAKVRGLKIRERRAQWENELKEKYSVKINQDLLEKI